MSYKITCRVFNTNPNNFFRFVEKGMWNYGMPVITMGGSGTCGGLRFQNDSGENVLFALGVHNYNRWGDIFADFAGDTAVTALPQYYGPQRSANREKVLTTQTVKSSKGTTFTFNYTVASGNDLKCNLIIA
ncbi:fungal fruit body lectin [Marasmius fiardii PR-910]|nr:fungal fruit body lectin [Marasmius fiardii PR-910]